MLTLQMEYIIHIERQCANVYIINTKFNHSPTVIKYIYLLLADSAQIQGI